MNIGNHTPYQDLFNNLVGDEVARQSFEAGLVAAVRNEQASGENGYKGLLESSLDHIHGQFVPMEAAGIVDDATKLRKLAAIGLTFYVGGLETIGDIYREKADVPQQPDIVSAGVDRLARTFFAVACSGSQRAASENLTALAIGIKPDTLLARWMSRAERMLEIPIGRRGVSVRSFDIEYKDDGQLEIGLRYKMNKEPSSKSRCPVAYARVESGQVKVPGLLQIMKAMGTVTVKQIYPAQFAMAE